MPRQRSLEERIRDVKGQLERLMVKKRIRDLRSKERGMRNRGKRK